MKRLINRAFALLAAVAALPLAGCQELPEPLDRSIGLRITEYSEGVTVYMDGDTPVVTIPRTGGSFNAQIDTELTWNATKAEIKTDSEGNQTEDMNAVWLVPSKEENTLTVSVDGFYYESDDQDVSEISRNGVVRVQIGNDPRAKLMIVQGAELKATVDIGTTNINMPSYGDALEFEVVTNQDSFEAALIPDADGNTADWVTVDTSTKPGYIILISPKNLSGEYRSTTMALNAGQGSNVVKKTIDIYQNNGSMVFIYDAKAGESIALPLCGAVDFGVDWGDDNTQSFSKTIDPDDGGQFVRHTYAQDGRYSVSVTGSAERMRSSVLSAAEKAALAGVSQWGNLGLVSLNEAFAGTAVNKFEPMADKAFAAVTDVTKMFYGCTALATVPADLFMDCKSIKEFTSVFEGCAELSNVSNAVFAECRDAESFTRTFANCPKLKTITASLFATNTKAVSFEETFEGCLMLASIPPALFKSNTGVVAFVGTFAHCEKIETLSGELFSKNAAVTSFNATFKGCLSLKTADETLFRYCLDVTDFTDLFNGCAALTGRSPNNISADKKTVFLYTRKDYPDEFATPVHYSGAFAGCTNLTDYETIRTQYSGWL